MGWLEARLKAWWEILHPTWRWLVLSPFAFFGFLDQLRDEVSGAEPQKITTQATALQTILSAIPLPNWPWQAWALCFTLVFILLLLESAYRAMKKRDGEIAWLEEKRKPEARLTFDQATGVSRNRARRPSGHEADGTFIRCRLDCLNEHYVTGGMHITEAHRSDDGHTFNALKLDGGPLVVGNSWSASPKAGLRVLGEKRNRHS